MLSGIKTWSAATIIVAAAFLAACGSVSPQAATPGAHADPYTIDPPKPYPTPSLPSDLVALTRRAGNGDSIAQCHLGKMYESGRDFLTNYARARELFTRSAAQHDGCGITNLGNLYFNGEGVPQSYATARAYYELAAQVGYPAAYYDLGEIFKYGDNVPVDERVATEWFKKAAVAKYANAYAELGNLYAFGHMSRVHNVGLAVQYYQMALAAHDPDLCSCASQNLAFLYLNVYTGTDSKRYRLVLGLLRRTPHDAWTQYQIAEMYRRGYGVKKDDNVAQSWLKKSADQGYGPAATAYAAYLLGETGKPAHPAAALNYLREAVLADDADGMAELGTLKFNGTFVPRDRQGGIELLTLASAHGSMQALNELANMYYNGIGVPRDHYKAYILFHVEEDLGANWRPSTKLKLEKEFTPQQLSAAQFEIKKLDQSALTALDEQTDMPPAPASTNATL
jgi:uncharacterized protein